MIRFAISLATLILILSLILEPRRIGEIPAEVILGFQAAMKGGAQ